MHALRRHDLVWPSSAGWSDLSRQARTDSERDCLRHWRDHRWPLVVARQRPGTRGVALGLPAPTAWGRLKLALCLSLVDVECRGSFPPAHAIDALLAPASRPRWRTLRTSIAALGIGVRVHGSHGWEYLTGLAYRHARSDLDLLLPVASVDVADAAVALLDVADGFGPRLDGELLFAGGAAVAWREWQSWRAGAARQLMVKRIDGVRLESRLDRVVAPMEVAA